MIYDVMLRWTSLILQKEDRWCHKKLKLKSLRPTQEIQFTKQDATVEQAIQSSTLLESQLSRSKQTITTVKLLKY